MLGVEICADYLFVLKNPHVCTMSPNAWKYFAAKQYPLGVAYVAEMAEAALKDAHIQS